MRPPVSQDESPLLGNGLGGSDEPAPERPVVSNVEAGRTLAPSNVTIPL